MDIFNFLYDFQQETRIAGAKRTAVEARGKAAEAQTDLQRLQRDHEKLKLVTMALWELLKSRTKLTDDDLARYVHEVDMSDGVRDGKVAQRQTRLPCEECRNLVPTSSLVCAYCGAAQPRRGTF